MPDERDTAGFDCLLAEVVRGREFCETPCEECHRRLAAELADLIEPSIPADPGEAGLACVDAFIREHTEKPVDRDALLALADEMQSELDECEDEHEIVGKLQYQIDRIREALKFTVEVK